MTSTTFCLRSWIFDGFTIGFLPLGARETKSIWVKTIEYPRSKAEGGWSHNVHLSRCSPVCNQELWRSALDLYCSRRWYFGKIVVHHRQTSKYTLSNEICFKFLTKLIKKLWPGKIWYFFAGHPALTFGDIMYGKPNLFCPTPAPPHQGILGEGAKDYLGVGTFSPLPPPQDTQMTSLANQWRLGVSVAFLTEATFLTC